MTAWIARYGKVSSARGLHVVAACRWAPDTADRARHSPVISHGQLAASAAHRAIAVLVDRIDGSPGGSGDAELADGRQKRAIGQEGPRGGGRWEQLALAPLRTNWDVEVNDVKFLTHDSLQERREKFRRSSEPLVLKPEDGGRRGARGAFRGAWGGPRWSRPGL
eukprot:Skav233791  [mRNA]  locus=scaffold780:341400:342931:- [translate_table: standard]